MAPSWSGSKVARRGLTDSMLGTDVASVKARPLPRPAVAPLSARLLGCSAARLLGIGAYRQGFADSGLISRLSCSDAGYSAEIQGYLGPYARMPSGPR